MTTRHGVVSKLVTPGRMTVMVVVVTATPATNPENPAFKDLIENRASDQQKQH
jgi:hypothetical protein